MSKAFWEGFRKGYLKTFWIGIALVVGWAFGTYFHPLEVCERKHESLEDVIKCVWIKENG